VGDDDKATSSLAVMMKATGAQVAIWYRSKRYSQEGRSHHVDSTANHLTLLSQSHFTTGSF
jgi:hypothetical protein